MILELLGHDFGYRLEHIIRMFCPNEKIVRTNINYVGTDQKIITSLVICRDSTILVYVKLALGEHENNLSKTINPKASLKEVELELCILLFKLLVKYTHIRPPWGVLTGVRPVAQLNKLFERGFTVQQVKAEFEGKYLVLPEKTRLALATSKAQKQVMKLITPNSCSLYISIPFCPSRCSYCSFVSHAIENTHKLFDEYIDLLCQEIQAISELIEDLNLELQSIYVGGGTPTILTVKQLEQLFRTIAFCLDTKNIKEYTLEAGRPDTITYDKLKLAKAFMIDRISINPQTLNQPVLDHIGRKHSVEEFYKAFKLAKEMNFKVINTDLIAGLPSESEDSFISGINKIIKLHPENITVHSLTIKRSSALKDNENNHTNMNLFNMLSTSQQILNQNGYFPYYLYRQKGTLQNQENVGYAKKDFESLYNIAMMEELQTVFGVGAGATSRLNLPDNQIKRVFNFKYPYEYIRQYTEIVNKKKIIRSCYEGT